MTIDKSSQRRLDLLYEYWDYNGIMPTMRELCEIWGVRSTNAVFKQLGKFLAGGYIEKTPGGRIKPNRQ